MNKKIKYIETGIISCPLLPENWAIKKLKYLAKVQTGRTPSIQGAKVDYFENGEINWFTPADFGNERYLDNSNRKVNQLALDNGEIQLFPNHSIYLVSIGATLGKIGISEKSGSANQQINVISFYEDINSVFGFYFLKSISSNLINEVDFTTLPILNQTKTKDIFVPFPSIDTQEIIANFLDQKTAELDNLISKKLKLIGCLKEEKQVVIDNAVTQGLNNNVTLKYSGIEWIGEIPEEWKIKRLKFNTYIKARVGWHGLKSDEFYFEGDGAYCITGTDFKNKIINWDNCYKVPFERYEEDPYIQLKEDDLLITKDGTIGKVALVKNLEGKATLNSGVFVVRPKNEDYINEYLYWILQSKVMTEFVNLTSRGSTIIHLYQDTFQNMFIPIPSIDEQKQIVDFIDYKTAEIDKIIKRIEREIELINEYRTSLINEVVTGKITLN